MQLDIRGASKRLSYCSSSRWMFPAKHSLNERRVNGLSKGGKSPECQPCHQDPLLLPAILKSGEGTGNEGCPEFLPGSCAKLVRDNSVTRTSLSVDMILNILILFFLFQRTFPTGPEHQGMWQ